MIGLAPSLFRAGGSAPDPAAIFGANLTAWYDSRVGVTSDGGSPERAIAWADQSPASGSCSRAAANAPKYVPVDTDGTPTIWFDPGETLNKNLTFAAGFSITPQATCYMLIELAATNGIPDMALWSTPGNVGLATRWTSNQIPTLFAASAYTPPIAAVTGWSVIRWGGDNPAILRSIAVNADAQNNTASTWPNPGFEWQTLSRTITHGATQPLRGRLKQFFFTDTFVQNADAEHAAVLAYFKSVYPTLVTY